MLFTWNDEDCSLPDFHWNACSYSLITVLFDEAPSFIDSGAGLSQLDFLPDSDFIYDSLFSNSVKPDSYSSGNISQPELKTPKRVDPFIRVYGSDEDL